ncbi:MAG: hypothetical protein IID45_15320, partial [Planctomycetes bacterium]|nr:hypothetical protein [Planctomycetota bacterium]
MFAAIKILSSMIGIFWCASLCPESEIARKADRINAKAARQETTKYLLELDKRFWARVKGFRCITGESYREASEALKRFLK